jgi:hypothetical protein
MQKELDFFSSIFLQEGVLRDERSLKNPQGVVINLRTLQSRGQGGVAIQRRRAARFAWSRAGSLKFPQPRSLLLRVGYAEDDPESCFLHVFHARWKSAPLH